MPGDCTWKFKGLSFENVRKAPCPESSFPCDKNQPQFTQVSNTLPSACFPLYSCLSGVGTPPSAAKVLLLDQCFSNFSSHQNHLQGLQGATPRVSASSDLGWGLRTCISNNFPLMPLLLVWRPHFESCFPSLMVPILLLGETPFLEDLP